MQQPLYVSIALNLKNQKSVIVSLGANLPVAGASLQDTLAAALVALGDAGLRVVRQSRFYATPCFPVGAGPDYVNAAAVLAVPEAMCPQDVLRVLHRIEADFGRERVQRWGMRSLDIDLVACEGAVRPDLATWQYWHDLPEEAQRVAAPDLLILPHPRVQDRAFVLVPMADVAPDWRHPILGKTVVEMLETLSNEDIAAVKSL